MAVTFAGDKVFNSKKPNFHFRFTPKNIIKMKNLLAFLLCCVALLGYGQEMQGLNMQNLPSDVQVFISSNNDVSLQQGMLAYYPYEANTNDLSGNNAHATFNGSAEYLMGVRGNAVRLEGNGSLGLNGDYVALPNLNLPNQNAITLNTWVNEEAMTYADGEYYIFFGHDTNGPLGIGHFNVGSPIEQFAFRTGNTAGSSIQINGASPHQNKWAMFTLSYKAGTMKAYINGQLVGTQTSAVLNIDGTNAAQGAHWWNSNSTRLTGRIDETRIYNRLLQPSEIARLYGVNAIDTICSGQLFTLTAHSSLASTYLWSNGATASSITPTPLTTTTYTVTVTAANGSTSTASRTIFVKPNPPVIISGATTICAGYSTTLTTSGGNYSWNTGATTASITVSPATTSTYNVTVTHANGCASTASATVQIMPTGIDCGLVAHYKFDNNLNDSSGNSNNGTAPNGITYTDDHFGVCKSAASFNGTNTYVSASSSTSLNSPQTNITLSGWAKSQSSTNGLYSIISKGILGQDKIQYRLGITSDKQMYFSYPTGNGQNFLDVLQAIPNVIIQNWNYYSVTWDGSFVKFYLNGNQIGSNQPLSTTLQIIPNSNLEIGRDASGLGNEHVDGFIDEVRIYNRALSSAEIQQLYNAPGGAPFSTSISGTNTICAGASTTLTTSGGTYSWSNGATTATINVSPNSTTTYTVTVTNASGCTATASRTVTVNPSPTANISGTNTICAGASTTLTTSGGTYSWSNGATTATINVSPASTTTYTVTVTNASGCTATASRTVTVNSNPTASISGPSSICSGTNLMLTATGGGNYAWSNAQTTASASISAAGTYTVTVTNAAGCTATASETVTAEPATTTDFTYSISGNSTVAFTNASTNATSYSWDFGDNQTSTAANPSHSYTNAGVYEVCLTATGICGSTIACQTVTLAPPGWNPEPCNTGIVHTVGILSDAITSIEGQALEPGDLVGFFHTDASGANICNNFGTWQGNALVFELCGDNPATSNVKEGYASGENFLVRVWKNNAEHDVIACFVPEDTYGTNNPNATGSFAPFGLSYVDCLKTPPAPGTDLGCGSPIPIACGETKTGNNSDGISSSISYNCFYNLVDGPEIVYEFINPMEQNVLITLTGLQEDLEVLLLDACDRNNCIRYSDRTGTIPEALLANSLPAGTYYIIVEGYLGADSPYSLSITCGPAGTNNGTLNCTSAITVQCGQTVTGNTNTGTDQIVQYGCSNTYNSGKEKIYSLTMTENKILRATMSGLTADLNLIALDPCNPSACIEASEQSGTENEAVQFYALAGKTYYFVVDGYFDAEGAYSLAFSCFDPCTNCPNDYDLNGPGGGTGGGGTPCELAQVLECGVPVSGNNSSGNAFADWYSCPNSYTIGKEVIYKFTINEAQDVTVILSGLSANLDLYLLDDCSVFNCHAASHKIGTSDEGLVVQALPVGTYYVVVDGYNNAISGYTLLVNCTNTTLTCQKIDLVAGTNFISSNILPIDPAIDAMFAPSAQSKIISIESQTNLSYSPFAQTDPAVFGDWDFRKAYRIKALEPVSIEVCGEKADPDTPIPFVALTPQGQTANNWSAYLKDDPALVGDKFTPVLTPKISRVFEMPTNSQGTLTPHGWVVTLQAGTNFQLAKGRGYILNATEDGEYSFGLWGDDSSDRSGASGISPIVENGCDYFQTPFYNSMRSATVILPKGVLEQELGLGDEIGIFRQDGSLFGSGRYNGHALSLVVSGDEVATPDFSEGFSEGEAMVFRLWKSAEGKVFDLKATFQSGKGDFENEAVYFVDGLEVLEVSEVQTPKMILEWAVYPNPARETIWFDLLLPQASTVHLELFSADGRQLRSIADQEVPAGRTVFHTETDKLAPGCYLAKMTTEQGVSFKKIIISKN